MTAKTGEWTIIRLRCPKCYSDKIGQYRMLTGAIWCNNCGFRVEQKERENPFIEVTNAQR